MRKSLQFPIQEKQIPIPIGEKAKFILTGLKKNCPKLYAYIKAVR